MKFRSKKEKRRLKKAIENAPNYEQLYLDKQKKQFISQTEYIDRKEKTGWGIKFRPVGI